MSQPEPGACGDPGCYVLHADPGHPIHPPDYEPETAGLLPCDRYCAKHPVCRLLNDQPIHYFDCDRFQTYGYGLRQGKCDCTATADVNEVLEAAYTAGYRQSVEDNA